MTILKNNFEKVHGEIEGVLDKYADPLEKATQAIVESNEQRVRRSDARKKKAALEAIESVRAAAPALEERRQ